MSSVPQGNRYAPPSAHVEDVVAAGTIELAGRGSRLGAVLLDVLAVGLVFWLASSLLFPSAMELMRTGAMSVLALLGYQMSIGFIAFLVLNGWLLATRGQTLGKLVLKIRITRTDGSKAGFARLYFARYLLNNVLCMIPVVGVFYALADCLSIFRESHKCLHDNIADTIVVKA